MKKILLVAFLFLLSVSSKANVFLANWNVEGYSRSDSPNGVNISMTPGVAKELRIMFNMTRDQSTQFNAFIFEIEHTSPNGTRTRIPGASYLNYNWQGSYTFNGIFPFTIPADKTEGEIQLVVVSYYGNQSKDARTIASYSLNKPTTPTTPTDPNTVTNYFRNIFHHNGDPLYNIHSFPYMAPPTPGSAGAFYPSETPVLTLGQAMYSPNGQYFLILQTDGSLVLYNINWQVLWSADTYQKGGQYLFFAPDGNLVLAKNADASGVVWASNIYAANKNFLLNQRIFYALQDDGNFVFYWNGGTFTDSMGATGTDGGRKSNHFRVIK